MSSTTERPEDPVAALEEAAAALEEAEAAVAEVGEGDARRIEEAHRAALRLLSGYGDSATGTGDFGAYVEFQEEVADLVEGLPDDLARRDAFEAFEETLEQRRLSEADFADAREALGPAAEVVERLGERESARERYRRARKRVAEERESVDARVEKLERVRELGAADVDAPVERLREPIEAYDEAVRGAFETFRAEAPARQVLEVVATAASTPLVDVAAPPGELLGYVRSAEVGKQPLPTLLEYADYSRSKLAHYVADADELKRRVTTNRTYLERLDVEPLTVGWPPPEAGVLRRTTAEYESVARRFAGEETVAACRRVRRLAERGDYERLRAAAAARAELTDEQRRKLRAGEVEAELAELRERRERLDEALEEHPRR